MMTTPTVTIADHTTASNPRPHILYTIKTDLDGGLLVTQRRYSEFVALHEALKDSYNLPPKRLIVTTFIPSAWADDALIAERKAGLAEYLADLLATPKYKDKSALFDFLSPRTTEISQKFFLEDALPSTLTRTKAMSLAAAATGGEVNASAVMISGAYYPDWSAGRRPPESIDYSKFDILFFSFVTPNSSSTISWGSGSEAILRRLVASARSSGYGTRIVLAVGGWLGCQWFSQACSTAANRTKFANSLASAVNTYNLDGIDLDWEYPNSPGAGNPYSPNDAANLLSLMKLLRTALGPCKILSAAVPHLPWLGTTGRPLTDVSEYAKVLTYVNIMNYDVWGSSANPGPNAPIGDLCKTSKQPQASAQAAFNQWTAAKFPANQLLLGLALYGYVSKSSKTVLTGSSMPSDEMVLLQQEEVKNDDDELEVNFLNGAHPNPSVSAPPPTPTSASIKDDGEVSAQATLTSWWGQQIPFYEIVRAGALVKRSDGNYGQAGGFTMGWDNCSNTPYLFNTAQTTVVSYDDTWSLTDKAKFAVSSGMAGCFTWSLDQDDGLTLQNAIRKGLGK